MRYIRERPTLLARSTTLIMVCAFASINSYVLWTIPVLYERKELFVFVSWVVVVVVLCQEWCISPVISSSGSHVPQHAIYMTACMFMTCVPVLVHMILCECLYMEIHHACCITQ